MATLKVGRYASDQANLKSFIFGRVSYVGTEVSVVRRVGLAVVSVLFLAILSNTLLMNSVSVVEAAAVEQPRYGGTLVCTVSTDVLTLNPAITISTATHIGIGGVFNSLLQRDPTGEKFVPDLAESWEVSKDGLAYTFRLVKNAVWHDGKPFTSADVKYTIEEVLYKYHPRGTICFSGLVRVDTPDLYTAIVRLKSPYPPFIGYMGNNYVTIVPKHLYEGTDVLNNPYNMKPVGTGPFKFKEYVKGNHITLERNEKYFKKGKPYLDKIVFKIILQQSAMVMAFEKGEVDHLTWQGFPDNEFARFGTLPGIKTATVPVPMYSIIALEFNVRNPPLSDVRVRQAMAYAIDKKEILEKASFGIGNVAIGPIASRITWAYNPNVPKYELNLAMANKLLDEAGYPKGADGIRFKTSLVYDNGRPDATKACEITRLRLKDIGIDVLLRPTDRATYEAGVGRWEFEIFGRRGPSGPDPSIGFSYIWGKNIRKVYATNCGGYNNSRLDWLYEQALLEIDQKKRAEYYFEMQEIAAKELPMIDLVETYNAVAFKAEFKGIPQGAWGEEPMDGVWWTKGSEVSPEAIQSSITAAGKELEGLRGQFYDVTAAQQQLEQAKKALEAGDYVKANELVKGAVKLAQPPYAMYGGIAVAVIAVIAGAALYTRRRKQKTTTK